MKLPKDKKVYVVGMSGIEDELREEGVAYIGGTVRPLQQTPQTDELKMKRCGNECDLGPGRQHPGAVFAGRFHARSVGRGSPLRA